VCFVFFEEKRFFSNLIGRNGKNHDHFCSSLHFQQFGMVLFND
jgi:hypothetical protein